VAAASLAGLLGIAFLVLTGCRETLWNAMSVRVQWLLAPCSGLQVEPKKISLTLIAFGLIGYVVLLGTQFPQNESFVGEDEEAYLITAIEIADSGGAFAFLKSLYSGEFAEANRHPIYLWLLSGSPEFESGKTVSVLIGLWTMGLVIGLCIQKRIGWVRTGLLCALLGLNGAWARFSVTIGCEVLLVGLVACVWFQLYGRPARLSDAEPDSSGRSRVDLRTVWVGVLLSLVWLTKGTGLLLTAGFVVWMALRGRLQSVPSPLGGEGGQRPDEGEVDARVGMPKMIPPAPSPALRAPSPPGGEGTERRGKDLLRELLVFGAVWVAVASPLLVRNVTRYGSPFYNVNSWLLFVDEYSDPVALSEASTMGEAATAYLASHSVGDILKREVTGLFWETFILVRSLGPPHPDDDKRIVPGTLIALLAALGWLVSRGEEKWLLLIWLAICLPMFAWYVPVAAGERFVLPLLVPVLCYAAEGAVHLAGKLGGRAT
jgi:hypothetical protein